MGDLERHLGAAVRRLLFSFSAAMGDIVVGHFAIRRRARLSHRRFLHRPPGAGARCCCSSGAARRVPAAGWLARCGAAALSGRVAIGAVGRGCVESQDRDFVIELDGQPGSYRLHVSSPAGDDSVTVGLDPARLGLDLEA